MLKGWGTQKTVPDQDGTDCRAVHLPGGNYLENVLIDIAKSHEIMDRFVENSHTKISIKRNRIANYISFVSDALLQVTNKREALINNRLISSWFIEFLDYWHNVINGRPLEVMDFLMLFHDYRKKAGHTDTLDWSNANIHIQNWQNTNQIFGTLQYCRKCALRPIRYARLSKYLRRNARVLEYGCGLAPMYRTYRSYLNHVPCNWLLADIPNFPFHYAKYTYHKDRCIEGFVTIDAELFRDPLRGVRGSFDLIIIQEVFEHLDDPVFVASYLIDRLKAGGYFLFDYIKSEGSGLDTPVALARRIEALKILDGRLTMVEGHFAVSDKDISRCVGRKI